ncbi:hypothetical protein ACGFNU_32045 [Spirillospora sp. NPDC048911]|uniref:hypothetical protein n=1 Tax=Spirillospora sp. NPDC048911 TaxID=3364527 RepID=UPI0037113E94
MARPRPTEPFQRVYSAPEPPARARRPRVAALVTALVSFAVAAAVVFLVLPGGDEREGAGRAPSSAPTGGGGTESAEPTAAPSASKGPASPSSGPTAAGAPPITALPDSCGTVGQNTVRRIIPGARRQEQSRNSTLTTCTYASTGADSRWLRVEAHLYPPGRSTSPVDDAKGYYSAQWTQARKPTIERTVSLGRQSGLGDEAFRWFKVDKGQPTVVGQVTVRLRNAVIAVSYSEYAESKNEADSREQTCLAKATDVAREVLAGIS